jgi:DNA-binding GntR family transcriptional regulator
MASDARPPGGQQDPRLADPRKYLRLTAVLRQQITDGQLQPGQAIPSITTLCVEHHMARGTARHAMQMLLDAGLVYRVPGLGYFVASAAEDPIAGDESTALSGPPGKAGARNVITQPW